MRGLVLRLAALGVGIALAMGVVELALPLVVERGACGGQTPFWRPDARVGWALVPGIVRDAVVCDARGAEVARHRIEVNTDGFRDRPRRRERSGGVPRVLVLGDSYVEAMQVDFADTFLARLEARLGVELLNAGVSGYSTDNELRAHDLLAPAWRPDAVLLVLFVGNDVMENGARLALENPHGLPPKPWLGLDAGDTSPTLARCYAGARAAAHVADAMPGFAWRASRLIRWSLTAGASALLTRFCDEAAGPPLVPGQRELFGVYGPPGTEAWREAWAATEARLAELAAHVVARGARFGVVLAPWQAEYDASSPAHVLFGGGRRWDFTYPYERLGAFLSARGIAWTSLRDALADHYASTGRTGAYAWDGHWDADGHAVVATALEPFVAGLVGR